MPRWFSIRPGLSLKGRKFKGLRGFAGKPFHPPLTDIPVTCYVLVMVFDVISYIAARRGGEAGTVARDFFVSATHVIIAGAAVSVLTILTGFWDWLKGMSRGTQAWRTANWHMALMLTASILVAADILLRLAYWEAGYTDGTVAVLSVLVGLLTIFGSLYGGVLTYEYGFNVETAGDSPVWHPSEEDVLHGQEIRNQS